MAKSLNITCEKEKHISHRDINFCVDCFEIAKMSCFNFWWVKKAAHLTFSSIFYKFFLLFQILVGYCTLEYVSSMVLLLHHLGWGRKNTKQVR